jgi:Na+-driven multidrug efflux pump
MIVRKSEPYALNIRKLGVDKSLLIRILKFGIPAGIQSSIFSITNVFITSASNVFPTTTVTAKTIAGNIDGITYTVCNSFFHSAMTFAGQNYGAMKFDRIKRVVLYSLIQVSIAGILVSQCELLFAEELCLLFVDANDPNLDLIISKTVEILQLMLSVYFLCGVMEVLSGILRGLGSSIAPMMCSVIGTAVLRILWVFMVFPLPEFNTITGLFMSYPVTWIITILLLILVLIIKIRSLGKINNSIKEKRLQS